MGHAEALGSLSGGDIAVIIIAIIGLAIIGLLFYLVREKKYSIKINLPFVRTIHRESKSAESVPQQLVVPEAVEVIQNDAEYIIGRGGFKCYVFRNGNMEPSTINKPLGNIFVSDPSMPLIGSVYLVQDQNGMITPYEPWADDFVQDKTPQWAYFATSWDVVSDVYNYELPWWRSAPLWVTIAVLILLLITLMIFFG